MPTNDLVDPAEEAGQRAERAKASLMARVELLKHKLEDAKDKLDLPAHIANHALPAVAIAFALGVAAGLRRGGPEPSSAAGGTVMRGAVWSTLAAFGLRAVRELALAQLGRIVRSWWDEQAATLTSELPPAERSPYGDPRYPYGGPPYPER